MVSIPHPCFTAAGERYCRVSRVSLRMYLVRQGMPPMKYRSSRLRVSMFLLAASVVVLANSRFGAGQTIETLAGTGHGDDDKDGGAALETNLGQPFGVQIGPDGALYICEFGTHRIRRLDLQTNHVSNIAGIGKPGYTGDGAQAIEAGLNQPHELRFDCAGQFVFH